MKEFTVMLDGKEVEVGVRLPNSNDLKEADNHSAKVFRKEVEAGTWLAVEADKIMRQKNLWNDEMDKRYTEIKKKLLENEVKITKRTVALQKGKHGKYDKNTFYGLCLQMRELRNELINLTSIRSELEAQTAEGKANNARINYLIYASTVYSNSGKRIFSSYEDFDVKSVKSEETKDWFDLVMKANEAFQEIYFGLKTNINDLLPENAWLKKYGFVNDNYHLVNEKGQEINLKGQLVDSFGRVIDEQGNLIDANGVPYIEDGGNGYYMVEPKPFVDEKGNPIIDDEYKAELAEHKKKLEAWEAKKKATEKTEQAAE